jgi:anti-anti-sigma factor
LSELADVKVELSGDIPVARVRGEVDLSNAEGILEQCLEGAIRNPGPGLVLDLSDVTYIDSSGIRVLFELVERLEALGKLVRAVVPEESSIRRVLELANAPRTIGVATTRDGALAALASAAS